MNIKKEHIVAKLMMVIIALAVAATTCYAAPQPTKLPSGVTSRLKKIDEYMKKVETAINAGKADRSNLKRAQETFNEILKQYSANATAEEVLQAQARIKAAEDAIFAIENAGAMSAVTSKLKQINEYLQSVESSLASGETDYNSLNRAKSTLAEIIKQYPSMSSLADVTSAAERIKRAEASTTSLEEAKKAAKLKAAEEEKAAEAKAQDWARRLYVYSLSASSTTDISGAGSKGAYGAPTSSVDSLVTNRSLYEEAKALYTEFLATGIDPDSHWQLRDAAYDVRVAIENYESSYERFISGVVQAVKDSRVWIEDQADNDAPLPLASDLVINLRTRVDELAKLLDPTDARMVAVTNDINTIMSTQKSIEKLRLSSRFMKPDVYTRDDAAVIKEQARLIVSKDKPGCSILSIHITKEDWSTESVVEWTDTTRTATQHRITHGIWAQVVIDTPVSGDNLQLLTLFIHRDVIGGTTKALTGHVVYNEEFIAANLPK